MDVKCKRNKLFRWIVVFQSVLMCYLTRLKGKIHKKQKNNNIF